MKLLFTLISLLLLSGCSLHLEIGAGKNDRIGLLAPTRVDWVDHGGVGAYVGILGKRDLTDRVDGMCYYKHFSQYDVGKPFDGRAEDTLDAYGCGVSIRLFGKE